MKRSLIILILLAACGASEPKTPIFSKEPISVRGWIADVETSSDVRFRTRETEVARKVQAFQSTNVWVDNAPYVSGGVAENGSFILLDVPPGNTTITFSAPGAPSARLVLQNVPGNSDVLIPALVLRRDSVALLDPKGVRVRMAARVSSASPTGANAIVAGTSVPVVNVPYAAMTDRRDYPNPPGAFAPLATVR